MSLFKSISELFSAVLGTKKESPKPKSTIKIREIKKDGSSKKSGPSADSAHKSAKAGAPKKSDRQPSGEKKKQDPKEKKGQNISKTRESSLSKEDTKSTRGEKAASQKEKPPRSRREAGSSRPKAEKKPVNNAPLIEDYPEDTWEYMTYLPPVVEGKKRFGDLNLPVSLLHGVHDVGFEYSTDIQAEILPHSLKGLDVTGRAQTGTGKTAAFLLTILNHLLTTRPDKPRKTGTPRALIMAPTRELVMQIEKDARALAKYTGARILAIFGGIDYEKQRAALEDDYCDIIIATPGRILDYYKQKVIKLNRVEILVLDEADRMLDMGFLPDMRRIIDAVPPREERQTMLFSATLTPEILRLASLWTNNPIQVEIEPEQVTSADIEQTAYIVSKNDKFTLLYNLLKREGITKGIIFANRKDEVKRLTKMLEVCDFKCGMLTGDVNQSRRIKTLENLRNGKIDYLIATDVAGRGIHVEGVEAVFNYTLPDDPDDYVHRIGRTGRAGAKGLSVAFATEEDSYVLPQIEEHIKEPLKYITPDEDLLIPIPAEYQEKIKAARNDRKRSRAPRSGDRTNRRKSRVKPDPKKRSK